MKRSLLILLSVAALIGVSACADDGISVKEPPPEKRVISVIVLDAKKTAPVLQFRADRLALNAVLQKVGALMPEQTITLRCEGGYNKQPPLYAFEFDIVRGNGGFTENLQGLGDPSTMHEICMQKAQRHLEYLREYAPKELDYYRE